MGLGKTVIALALILKNPPPHTATPAPHASAPAASTSTTADPSSAPKGPTLIVATPALLGQWENEVRREPLFILHPIYLFEVHCLILLLLLLLAQVKQHAPSLNVVVYDGLKASINDATKKGKRKAWKNMSRDEKFKHSQVPSPRLLPSHIFYLFAVCCCSYLESP